MSQKLLDAIGETIREEILPHLAEEGTIEAYTKHYFMKWYKKNIAQGNDITLEAFLEQVPDNLKKTRQDLGPAISGKYSKLINAVMEADLAVPTEQDYGKDFVPDDL